MAEELWRHTDPASTAMWRFIQSVNAKHNLNISDYKGLYRWSIDNVALFWEECWNFVGIKGEVDGKVCMNLISSDILHLSVGLRWDGDAWEVAWDKDWSRFKTHKNLLASHSPRIGSIQRCFQFAISHGIATLVILSILSPAEVLTIYTNSSSRPFQRMLLCFLAPISSQILALILLRICYFRPWKPLWTLLLRPPSLSQSFLALSVRQAGLSFGKLCAVAPTHCANHRWT
jgi:hypothetical protein